MAASLFAASLTHGRFTNPRRSSTIPGSPSFRTLSNPPAITVSVPRPKSKSVPRPKSKVYSSLPPPLLSQAPPNPSLSPLTGSTRTITTIFSVALALFKLLASKIPLVFLNLAPNLPSPNTLVTVSRPAFFAAIGNGSAPKSTSAPIAVIAAGLARWLEIYSCVLLIRVLLSWFPNIPWDQQPMSAIRDLCDPYLSLFRGIIPPLFNSLDVSPILAFLLLGLIGQLARPPRPY